MNGWIAVNYQNSAALLSVGFHRCSLSGKERSLCNLASAEKILSLILLQPAMESRS